MALHTQPGSNADDPRQVYFPFGDIYYSPFLENVIVVVRWGCGKRGGVFQGLWKAMFAFHQAVMSTASLISYEASSLAFLACSTR